MRISELNHRTEKPAILRDHFMGLPAVSGAAIVAQSVTTANNNGASRRPVACSSPRARRLKLSSQERQVVMTSSISAIMFGRGVRENPFTEAEWTDETNRDDTSPYDRAKTIAERAAWAWHKAEGGGLELVTVNPGLVLGPVLGSEFSASLEAVRKLLDGSIPALPHFGFNVVDVRDIAALHMGRGR